MIKLKDSLTGNKKTLDPKLINIYACGITPYSPAHVGHARSYVVFDLLRAVLEKAGHQVNLVRNITDIDDKIISAAAKEGLTWKALSNKYSAENTELMQKTKLVVPFQPNASDYLPDIFSLIYSLIKLDHAYVSDSGDVLYRVSSFTGKALMPHEEGSLLSEQGVSRVNVSNKEDSRDFALWKKMPSDEIGFDSPWGWGRPGWHIECSAMINAIFGGSVHIHGGGVDLKFPHHQAEIMQSEPVTGKPLADVWMHNGSVLSAGQKMSKSLNNFITWGAALQAAENLVDRDPELGADLLRIALLQAHWQKPLDWSEALLQGAKDFLTKIVRDIPSSELMSNPSFAQESLNILQDNLNTPKFFFWLNSKKTAGDWRAVLSGLRLFNVNVEKWHAYLNKPPAVSKTIVALLIVKEWARDHKNWKISDQARTLLVAEGIPAHLQNLTQFSYKDLFQISLEDFNNLNFELPSEFYSQAGRYF